MFLSKANTEDVDATLAGQPYASASDAILYVSFTINYTNLPSSAGSYFAEFKDGGTGFSRPDFCADRGRGQPAPSASASPTPAASPSAVFNADLQTNTDYTVVARLAVSNVVSTLWINPAAETNAGVTATDAASALTITSYGFREDGAQERSGIFLLMICASAPRFPTWSPTRRRWTRPAIISQPQNQTVTNGANVTFSVSASGTPPPAYQWQFTPASDVGARRHEPSGGNEFQSHVDGRDVRPGRLLFRRGHQRRSVRPAATRRP